MLDERYYKGFWGENEVRLWVEKDGEEYGLSIWCGFFDTIMEGCFRPYPSPNGMVWCWQYCEGFYNNKWEVPDPTILLQELNLFDPQKLEETRHNLIKESEEVRTLMISFISEATKNGQKIYMEYM